MTLCDLVTVFAETKSVTKSRLHCIHKKLFIFNLRIWFSNENINRNLLRFCSFTEGDTVALRESLAQLSGASSPTESVVSTSSNPSAASSISIRGGRREKSRRGKKKGQSGSGSLKSASRGSTPPLLAD